MLAVTLEPGRMTTGIDYSLPSERELNRLAQQQAAREKSTPKKGEKRSCQTCLSHPHRRCYRHALRELEHVDNPQAQEILPQPRSEDQRSRLPTGTSSTPTQNHPSPSHAPSIEHACDLCLPTTSTRYALNVQTIGNIFGSAEKKRGTRP